MIALLLATAVWGATYHVAPNGNDAAAGTEAAPWKTLGKVNDLHPGDTLLVHEGTYVQGAPIGPYVDGTEGAPITVQGVGAVTITGPTARVFSYAPDLQPVEWFVFRHLRFYETMWPVRFSEGANHVTFEDIEIDRCFRGIEVFGGGDLTFRRVWIHHSLAGIGLAGGPKGTTEPGPNGVLVEDCLFENCLDKYCVPPLPWAGSDGITDTEGVGAQTECSSVVIRRCVARNMGDTGFDVKCGTLVDSCFSTGSPNGYKLWGISGPAILRNSVAVNNLDTGVTFGAGVIESCTLANNGRCELRPNGPYPGITLRNTIMVGGDEFLVRAYRAKSQSVHGQFPLMDHVLMWKPVPPNPTLDQQTIWYTHDGDCERVTLGQLQTGAVVFGPGGVYQDPLLVDAGAGNVRLLLGSPARKAGLVGANVLTDCEGNLRGVVGARDDLGPYTGADLGIAATAYDHQDLKATAGGATDADGDPITYRFAWYCNGALQANLTTDTVPAARTQPGEVWRCEVVAWDGEEAGPTTSASIVVLASGPTQPVVTITPSAPRCTDPFTATASSATGDATPIVYAMTWWRNGAETALHEPTVLGGVAQKRDHWRCVVIASANGQDSAPGEATVTVVNTPPSAATLTVGGV